MLNQVSIYCKAKHLSNQAQRQLRHPGYPTIKLRINNLCDVPLFDIFNREMANFGKDILIKKPTNLRTMIFTIFEINICPMLKQLSNGFTGSLTCLLRFSSLLLGLQPGHLSVMFRFPRRFLCV